jgi:ABC-2 type transport system permease protein
MVGRLLWPKTKGLANGWRKASASEKLLISVFLLCGLLFWLGLSGIFWYLIKTLYAIEIVGPIVLRKLMDLLLLSLFGLLCFSNVVTALSNYYLSADLELLLALPIPRAELHIARLLDTLGQSSWMALSLGLPILICYGMAYDAHWDYYALTALSMGAFILIPASIGVTAASLLVTIFPARRLREALMLVGVASMVFIFILLRWIRPERLASTDDFQSVAAYVAELQTPAPILLPPQWASEVILASLSGREVPLLELGLLLSGAIAACGIGRWITSWLYDDGRSKSQEARTARMAKAGWLDRLIRIWTIPLSPAARCIVSKDIKTFVRDPAQWTQLFLVASIVAIAIISVASLPVDTFKGPWMKSWINGLAFLILALVGFVMAALAARFQFSAVSNEGRSFWVVRTGPLEAMEFLGAKAWPGFLPMLLIGEGLAVSSTSILQAEPLLIGVAMVTALGLSFSLSGLAVGMGAMYPDFKNDNASKLAASPAGMLYMVAALSLVFLTLALEAPPVFFLLSEKLRGIPMTDQRTAIGAACMAATSVLWIAASIIPMRIGARRLWNMELPNG